MANLCIKTPSSAILVLIFQLLVLRPRPHQHFQRPQHCHWPTTKIKTILTLKESHWIQMLRWRQLQTQANAPLFLHHLETSACPLLETRFATTMVVEEALPKILRWSSTAAVVAALMMWLVLLIRSLGPDSGNQSRTGHYVRQRAVGPMVSKKVWTVL